MNIPFAKYDGRKVMRRVKNSRSPRAYRDSSEGETS